MRAFLASPRRRRRLAWAGTSALVAGGIVAVGALFSGGGEPVDVPLSNAPFQLPEKEQPEESLRRGAAGTVLNVAGKFLVTAVNRRHVDASWELASPTLRAGYTRATWSKGEIPIVPYPVNTARWEVDYTYHDRVGLKVAVFPKRGSKVAPAVFLIDLREIATRGKRRWVVDSWQPLPEQPAGGTQASVAGIPDLSRNEAGERQLSAAWIFVPIGVLSLFALVLASVGGASWYRGRRADQAYLRSHSGARSG
jgi:hypothetical protein